MPSLTHKDIACMSASELIVLRDNLAIQSHSLQDMTNLWYIEKVLDTEIPR